jgi:intein/homing endonuclease
MAWTDFFKLFNSTFTLDPLSKKSDRKNLPSAGVSSNDVFPDPRNTDSLSSGTGGFIRVQNDLVDLTTTTNRVNRYKEYDRLVASISEIEMAMTVFADEACVYEDTIINTVFHGPKTIKWLQQNKTDDKFPVYCYDFKKEDYTVGWSYAPRFVKKAKTVRVILDNGEIEIVTPDHRILRKDGEWIMAENLKFGDKLMPFYKIKANQNLTKVKTKQFPRIFTHNKGWIHERQFLDEWRSGKDLPEYEKVNKLGRLLAQKLHVKDIAKLMGVAAPTLEYQLSSEGFSCKEFRLLSKNLSYRRVIKVEPWHELDVYDLSVEDHKNFCTQSLVMHNCQKDEDGQVFKITCKNQDVKEELETLFFKVLEFDQLNIWDKAKRLFIKGDAFWEIVVDPDNPKDGILKIADLPPDNMYRIESTKGKVLEYQQAKEGPDYQALLKAPLGMATDNELAQSMAIRFTPDQIIHLRIGDYRKSFYPYGVSLIEPARGPAHQLKMMEDSMVVYRLCLAGNTRIRTADYYKYIKDLDIGDIVYSFSESGKQMPTTVEAVKNNGKQKVYDVISRHVSIRGNETHPILVNRDGVYQYVDVKNLIPGKDKFILTTKDVGFIPSIPRIYGPMWAKLNDEARKEFKNKRFKNKSQLMRQCSSEFGRVRQFLYTKGKALPLERAKEICNIFGIDESKLLLVNKGENNSERISLPERVTEEFAKLFGFICGDGSIHNNNQISFSSSEDDQINQYYSGLLQKYFGKVRFELDKRSKKKLGKFVSDSTTACKVFGAMGYIHNHHNTRIPKWVFNSPKNIRRAFVEGLSDADGCERFTKKGTWFSTIELCNEKLIEDIKELWSSIGLCSGQLKKRTRENKHLLLGRKLPVKTTSYLVTISDNLLPKEENITKVVEVGEEDVYDITVNSNYHNFIANGIPVHNTRAPERRIFYIDIGGLPSFKAEAFINRMKDQFRKKKMTHNMNNSTTGASAVDERWHAPAVDEDIWIPVRQNSTTRIDTLPGAQNLGEIDDTVYFRTKLFAALNFPPNYFYSQDANATRITLSANDVKFAKLIERLQAYMEYGYKEIAIRHLKLIGYPENTFEDIKIKMTPPSDWRELSRAEVITNRINNANSLKGSQLLSDYDILTKWMKYPEDEAKEMIARMKIQKLEDLKLQVLAQNPQLLGVGIPGMGEQEISAQPGGPNPMLGPDQQMPPGGPPAGPEGPPPEVAPQSMEKSEPAPEPQSQAKPLPNPTDDDIIKYDLELQDYDQDQDYEEPDYSEGE